MKFQKFPINNDVRRPIGAKILGITLILLFLMGVVTYSSNYNLRNLSTELSIWSDYYIPLDQAVNDFQRNYLTQILFFERASSAKSIKDYDVALKEGEKIAKETVTSKREDMREARRKVKKLFSSVDQQNVAIYALQMYYTDQQVMVIRKLVDAALKELHIASSLDHSKKFTQLQSELSDIPKLRDNLHIRIVK